MLLHVTLESHGPRAAEDEQRRAQREAHLLRKEVILELHQQLMQTVDSQHGLTYTVCPEELAAA